MSKRKNKTKHPLYSTWHNMRTRCYRPDATGYSRYGGRGIKICKCWLNDFWAFAKDMGPKPNPELSLDRIDGDGNYEPSNCRWATHREQMNNARNNVMLTFRGITKTLPEWAREIEMSPLTLRSRIFSCGWPIGRALTEPVRPRAANK